MTSKNKQVLHLKSILSLQDLRPNQNRKIVSVYIVMRYLSHGNII